MKKEDLPFLKQLIQSMIEGEIKLERYYLKKDHKNFDDTKKLMMDIQKKISDTVK